MHPCYTVLNHILSHELLEPGTTGTAYTEADVQQTVHCRETCLLFFSHGTSDASMSKN